MHNYYEILNINSNASKNEIKNAFKKEALKWHPDRNKSPNATIKMQLINEAYLILKDDNARARYDKEYQRYYNFQKQSKNDNKEKYNNNYQKDDDTINQKYVFEDEILKDWIKKAKKQAINLAKQSIDDLVGMSRAATRAAWEKIKYYILLLIMLISLFKIIGIS